jgi:hypothetical protein
MSVRTARPGAGGGGGEVIWMMTGKSREAARDKLNGRQVRCLYGKNAVLDYYYNFTVEVLRE